MSKAIRDIGVEEMLKIQKEGSLVVDTRDYRDFSYGLVPDSVNIPFGRRFRELMEDFVLRDRSILLVTDPGDKNQVNEAVLDMGYSNAEGCLKGGIKKWEEEGKSLDLVISISPEEFTLDVKHDKNITIFDLRDPFSFKDLHVERSENRKSDDVIASREALLPNKTYYIFCREGSRSMALISYLKMLGHHNLHHVDGGFEAIRNKDVPLVEGKKKKKGKSSN